MKKNNAEPTTSSTDISITTTSVTSNTISNSTHTNIKTCTKSTTPKSIQSDPFPINNFAIFNVQGLCPKLFQAKSLLSKIIYATKIYCLLDSQKLGFIKVIQKQSFRLKISPYFAVIP